MIWEINTAHFISCGVIIPGIHRRVKRIFGMLAIPVGYRRAFVFRPGLQKFYISQPSLTNSIHELEQELGLTIFHRTNRGVVLTPDGEFRRATWHLDFMWGFDGIDHKKTETGLPFHGEAAMIDDTFLTGKIHLSGEHPFEENVNAYYRDRQQAGRGRAVGKTPAGQGDRRDRLGRFSAQPISVSTFGAGSAILKLNKTYKNRRFSL